MADSGLIIGWNRAVPGREAAAAELFEEFKKFFDRLREQGRIESYEPVILAAHGGDLNGFFLLRGEAENLNALKIDHEFLEFTVKANIMLLGFGVIRAYIGAGVNKILSIYSMTL